MNYRKGFLLSAVIAVAIVSVAVGLSVVDQSGPTAGPEYSEFDSEATVSEPLSQSGAVEPDSSVSGNGGVVIDDANSVSLSRSDIQPLVEGIGRAGYDVSFRGREDMSTTLSDADALVIIDPGTSYDEDELDAIEAFVDAGGRLLILGEPTRTMIGGGPFGAQIVERDSELTELGSRFDLQFDTRYVYDQTRNDGTYQQVVAEPRDGATLPPEDGTSLTAVNDVAFTIATEVRSTGDADPILVTSESARTVGMNEPRRHTLAVRDGNVLAIGDASFIAADRYNVGDTDVFLSSVVEFLLSGDSDYEPAGDGGTDSERGSSNGEDGGSDGESADSGGETGNSSGTA